MARPLHQFRDSLPAGAGVGQPGYHHGPQVAVARRGAQQVAKRGEEGPEAARTNHGLLRRREPGHHLNPDPSIEALCTHKGPPQLREFSV